MNFLCCNIFNNLVLNTKELNYSDINDFYREESKGFQFGTGFGGSTNAGESALAPKGSTTIGLTSTGYEREQETRATIGNGNITIGGQFQPADSSLLAGLNRDVNNSQEITKDMITGALDGSMTIDNRILLGFIEQNVYERDKDTGEIIRDDNGKAIIKKDKDGNNMTTNGYQSIASDVKNFIPNTGLAVVGAMSASETILEYGRKATEQIPVVGVVVSQPFSAGEGFFDYFVENDSKAYVYDKSLNDEKGGIREAKDIKEGKDYYTNGIMNTVEGDVKKYLNDNPESIVRYNPTSGAAGDLMESTLGKLLNWNGLTAQLGSMNRIIANDLTTRKDIQYSNNNFHSQGTINGTGAMNIMAWNGVKLDNTQSLNAKGPAVYNKTWDNTASQVLDRKTYVAANDGGLGKQGEVLYSNITYSHNEKDPLRYLTSPRAPWDPFVGIYYGITNMKEHNIGSYK